MRIRSYRAFLSKVWTSRAGRQLMSKPSALKFLAKVVAETFMGRQPTRSMCWYMTLDSDTAFLSNVFLTWFNLRTCFMVSFLFLPRVSGKPLLGLPLQGSSNSSQVWRRHSLLAAFSWEPSCNLNQRLASSLQRGHLVNSCSVRWGAIAPNEVAKSFGPNSSWRKGKNNPPQTWRLLWALASTSVALSYVWV